MIITNYYRQDWAPDGIDPCALEKELGKNLEPKGLASLHKLPDDLAKVSDDDLSNISTYMEFQRIRVPRQAEIGKALAKFALEREISKTKSGRDALKVAEVVIKDSFRFEFIKTLINSLTPYFTRMLWEVIEAPDDTSFITSDSPVTFLNGKVLPPEEPGLKMYGTMVAFPISPKYLLLLKHPKYGKYSKAGTCGKISICRLFSRP